MGATIGVSGYYLEIYSASKLPPKITRTITSKATRYSYKGNK